MGGETGHRGVICKERGQGHQWSFQQTGHRRRRAWSHGQRHQRGAGGGIFAMDWKDRGQRKP